MGISLKCLPTILAEDGFLLVFRATKRTGAINENN